MVLINCLKISIINATEMVIWSRLGSLVVTMFFTAWFSVVEHITVISEVEDENIPEMTSRDENLSFSPVIAGTSFQSEQIEKIKISSDSNPRILKDSISLKDVRTEVENVGIIIENRPGVQELYLDRVYQKQETQEFYCPKCKTCIQKVLIQTRDWEEQTTSSPPQSPHTFICTSCFGCLIPIGTHNLNSLSPLFTSMWENWYNYVLIVVYDDGDADCFGNSFCM